MYIQCGDTVIAAAHLSSAVHQLAMRDPHARMTGFEKEFKVITDHIMNSFILLLEYY